jgi:hypothetical protein
MSVISALEIAQLIYQELQEEQRVQAVRCLWNSTCINQAPLRGFGLTLSFRVQKLYSRITYCPSGLVVRRVTSNLNIERGFFVLCGFTF